MKHLLIKDQYRRRKSVKAEQKRNILKYFQSDSQFFRRDEVAVFNKCFDRFGKNASIHRVVSRCLLTRRSKGVFKFFALERRILRYLIINACHTGIRRAFW
jgi:small subunit ribosomal protein S14